MSESTWVRAVSAEKFEELVVAASHDVPVLVDFWAAWCGPCRALGPVLERIADHFGGKLIVAKVDTENNQELATRFQIRGIPACKLFVDGVVADEFVGALPESAVLKFLAPHIKSEVDAALAEVAQWRGSLTKGNDNDNDDDDDNDNDNDNGNDNGNGNGNDNDDDNAVAAQKLLASLLDSHPDHPGVVLEAARVALALGDLDLARTRATSIKMGTDEFDDAQALLGIIDLAMVCHQAGGLEAATIAVTEANPTESSAARYAYGACLAAAGQFPQALEVMLKLVGDDRKFNDDAARKAMLVLFAQCSDDAMVREFRRRLSVLI